ncbi:hypothetical protein H4Q26_008461 [Puccinia striiformis f. sp. tritici PST-130]|nr:hypothetical protein H4Q26_008461 [Puccinia striiformis f. sp. tritici PST-130]
MSGELESLVVRSGRGLETDRARATVMTPRVSLTEIADEETHAKKWWISTGEKSLAVPQLCWSPLPALRCEYTVTMPSTFIRNALGLSSRPDVARRDNNCRRRPFRTHQAGTKNQLALSLICTRIEISKPIEFNFLFPIHHPHFLQLASPLCLLCDSACPSLLEPTSFLSVSAERSHLNRPPLVKFLYAIYRFYCIAQFSALRSAFSLSPRYIQISCTHHASHRISTDQPQAKHGHPLSRQEKIIRTAASPSINIILTFKSTQESDHHNSINQPSPSNSNLPSLSEISHLDNQHARLHDNLPPQAAPSRTISSEYQPSRPVPPHLPSSASTNQAPSAQPTRLPLAPTKQLIYSSIESIDFAAASIPLTENSDSAALNRLLSSFIEQARLQDGNLKLPSSPLDPQDLESLRLALCPPAHVQLNPSSPFYDLCSSSPTSHPSSGPYFYDQTSKNQRPLRKRALPDDHRLLLPRQSTQGNGSGPSADGYPGCTAVSNAILSCFPEPRTVLTQHTWSKFIWNNNYPTFIGSRLVDIYLYNANSESPVANWTQIPNDRGMIGIYADDSWFPPVTSWQDGRNLTYPYFFIITTAGATLTGGEQHQATFRVVQTAPPQAYITASLASASHSSQLAASMTTNSLLTPSATPNSNLQRGPSGDAFPRWEIALIVVLGAFALLIFLVAAYLAFTNARKRRQVRIWQAAALGGNQ